MRSFMAFVPSAVFLMPRLSERDSASSSPRRKRFCGIVSIAWKRCRERGNRNREPGLPGGVRNVPPVGGIFLPAGCCDERHGRLKVRRDRSGRSDFVLVATAIRKACAPADLFAFVPSAKELRMNHPATDQAATPLRMLPMRLHHHAYTTDDHETTRHFYERILGLPLAAFEVERERRDNGWVDLGYAFYELGDGSTLAFFTFDDP